MMITHFMNNTILRGLLAVSLVILLADPCGHLIAASSPSTPSDKDYWKMTEDELRLELEKVVADFEKLRWEEHKLKGDIHRTRNNQYAYEIMDLYSEIDNQKALAEAKQIAIDKHEADALVDQTEPTESERARIQQLERKISQLNKEIAVRTQRINKVRAEQLAFEKSVWPRVKAVEDSYAPKTQPLYELRDRIEQIYTEKFEDPIYRTQGSAAQNTISTQIDPSRPQTTQTFGEKEMFIQDLLAEWGGKLEYSPFPERFWRMGLDEFSKIRPDSGGKRALTLFRDYDAAVQFFKRASRTADPTIYALRTTDLAETPEGRAFLLEIKDQLLNKRSAGVFRFEIPNEEVYKATFLEKVRPRPSFFELLPPEPAQRPPRSKLPVEEHPRSSSESKKDITLHLARNQQLLEESPELRGADHSQELIEPDAVQERLEENFDRQQKQTLDEALKNEPPEIKTEINEKMKEVAEKHNPKAIKACIEQGKRTFNMQLENVKKTILRGRTYYSEIYNKGMANLSKSKMPWHNRGLGVLFLVLGIWDIAYVCYHEGWRAEVWLRLSLALSYSFLSMPIHRSPHTVWCLLRLSLAVYLDLVSGIYGGG